MATMDTSRAIVQLYPMRYLGASVVFHTLHCQRRTSLISMIHGGKVGTYSSGSHAPNAFPIVFIVEITRARSSALPAQISFAQA